MIEKVSFIEEYNTSMGHIAIANADRVFHVGQIIESSGKRYSIKGFPIVNNAKPDVVSMVISEVK